MTSRGLGFRHQPSDVQMAAAARVSGRVGAASRSAMGDELYAIVVDGPALASGEDAAWLEQYETRRAELSANIVALLPVLDVHQLERALGQVTAIADEIGGIDG